MSLRVWEKKQALRGSLPWWSEGSCRTADHVCEFVNRFPADRRKVEVSLFSVVFETACGFIWVVRAPQRINTLSAATPKDKNCDNPIFQFWT